MEPSRRSFLQVAGGVATTIIIQPNISLQPSLVTGASTPSATPPIPEALPSSATAGTVTLSEIHLTATMICMKGWEPFRDLLVNAKILDDPEYGETLTLLCDSQPEHPALWQKISQKNLSDFIDAFSGFTHNFINKKRWDDLRVSHLQYFTPEIMQLAARHIDGYPDDHVVYSKGLAALQKLLPRLLGADYTENSVYLGHMDDLADLFRAKLPGFLAIFDRGIHAVMPDSDAIKDPDFMKRRRTTKQLHRLSTMAQDEIAGLNNYREKLPDNWQTILDQLCISYDPSLALKKLPGRSAPAAAAPVPDNSISSFLEGAASLPDSDHPQSDEAPCHLSRITLFADGAARTGWKLTFDEAAHEIAGLNALTDHTAILDRVCSLAQDFVMPAGIDSCLDRAALTLHAMDNISVTFATSNTFDVCIFDHLVEQGQHRMRLTAQSAEPLQIALN